MPSVRETIENKEVGLIDILDVILDKGVAIKGDLIISIAGVDLVYLDLRVLISSVETLVQSYENNRKDVTSDQFDDERRALVDATGQPNKWTD
ncbi:gas vesicle protein [Virgibacillus halodenitrificans]|jgi:gas vesicle structural protein|uniref:Gas vesicle protein GvpS n=1 Tax=Virgibacillus halodenitrificans TaxID=1482 RepID=A0AAC9NKU2_VIRHA|nr:gas vesicle protein [Virgibacillus halodenitrificans]APC47936.1 gas vesicle protein GvpS [Virgibacillus halodenitrificans]MCG1028986.1 gas vesicle protein [Virgibacillus halodenitrificans]MCJ0933252.1 gas vesicle protein [Virgibacillus halodenitrificans]MEC2160852.1 gas vesicle protein [Virgibacillus halodenitrificans]MYL45115.1 gas vesicle protein [Virgibacillus halodenitrificans]